MKNSKVGIRKDVPTKKSVILGSNQKEESYVV